MDKKGDILSFGPLGTQSRSGGACKQQPDSSVPGVLNNPTTTVSSLFGAANTLDTSTNNNHHGGDTDFTHDNSDYQWFLDYNYRDSSCQHASILSSLSSSYKGLASLACYEELARDMDANLAEADMESFRTKDIHALLSNLPPSACHLMQDSNRRGEMFASISSSMMEKFHFDSSISPNTSTQGEDSTAGSINTMSICKSELLFSPVKESVPCHFSVDSLDCDQLEQDLILTCQANKHNYTIAFEGSITMYSEDSDCPDTSNEKQDLPKEDKSSVSSSETHENSSYSTEKFQKPFHLTKQLDSSLAQSDSGHTTWSKMKNRLHSPLRRHPSGNNNQHADSCDQGISHIVKSQSAPDLRLNKQCQCSSNNSDNNTSSHAMKERFNISEMCKKCPNLLRSNISDGMYSSGDSRGPHVSRPQNINLIKLFMKQKSLSNDRIGNSSTMDQSSECWPNSSEGGDCVDSFNKHQMKMNLSSDKEYQSDDGDSVPPDPRIGLKKWIESEANGFEDSLMGANYTDPTKRTHDYIIEEEESAEKTDEKSLYATVNKTPKMRFNTNNININNNNSPIRIRGNAMTQTKKSVSSSTNSVTMSSFTESDATQVTRMQRLHPKDILDSKATSTQNFSSDVIDKSIQTSYLSSIHIGKDKSIMRVVQPSFLDRLKKGDIQKPIYVLYPDYTLPNLDFISKTQDLDKILLKPMKFASSIDEMKARSKGQRPFSCNDVEGLRKKGFNHIRDWDSLTFLLPMEYRQILAGVPEVVQQLKDRDEDMLRREEKPLFCLSPPVKHKQVRPMSCDCTMMNHTNVSSSSSTATQPSSGYRGSSTMLTDSSAQNSPAPNSNYSPLFVYKYDSATSSEASFMNEKYRTGIVGIAPPLPRRSASLADKAKSIDVAPPRPPLPKSILRKSADKKKMAVPASKRYSMFEIEDHLQDPTLCMNAQIDQKAAKRRSLQEPYYLLKNNSIVEMKKNNDLAAKRISQQFLDAAEKDIDDPEFFHDEGVGTESSLDSGKSHGTNLTTPVSEKCKDTIDYNPYVFPTSLNQPIVSSTDLQQLEEFLKHSGINCNEMEEWDNIHMQKVKNQVSKFLSMKRSQGSRESLESSCSSGHSKKSVSFKSSDASCRLVEELKAETLISPPDSPKITGGQPQRHYQGKNLAEITICEEGESSPEGYASPSHTQGIYRQSSTETNMKKGILSNVLEAVDMIVEDGSCCPQLVLGALCPTLYAFLSDGLRKNIQTSFGPADNSVWQVVEASARQGPITKSLNELVMRINSEDALSESVLKFNAFIMGLLNVRSVDAWISYLKTRESVLRKHYSNNALLRGGGGLMDGANAASLATALAPLATMPFKLDLLWQMKEMHRSFKRMEDLMSQDSSYSNDQLSKNQRNLLRLIHSIQSSAHHSSDDQPEPTPQASVIMRNKQKLPDLLDSSDDKTASFSVKARPRSCVNPTIPNFSQLTGIECPNNSSDNSLYDPTRRWSGVQLGSKLIQAFDRLALYDDNEEYSDSLNTERRQTDSDRTELAVQSKLESNSSSGEWSMEQGCGGKFRRLQRKWEMLSGQESSPQRSNSSNTIASTGSTPGSTGSTPGSTSGKSRIPRPVTSPVRSNVPLNSTTVSPVKRQIPVPIGSKKVTTPPGSSHSQKTPLPPLPHGSSKGTASAKKSVTNTNRISRVEACNVGPPAPRPSSLPYRKAPAPSVSRPRRAISSSQPRQAGVAPTTQSNKTSTKMVRTLWHRLPSDSGHLAFNEGERLRLVLEVDDQWLLCCRGQQKGLVPRNAVIAVPDSALQKF